MLLFMFTDGLELDLAQLRAMAPFVVLISNRSILAPFALGVSVAFYLNAVLTNGTLALYLALFMGAARSITAFPVLARILSDGQLLQTR